MSRQENRTNARRSASLIAAALLAATTSSAQASSMLELYGTFTGAGTINVDVSVISWRADNLEWTIGTYSHSGGSIPGGGFIGGGGIDSVLNVSAGTTLLGSSDNLSATNRDSEVRTNNVTGRPGATILPPQDWATSFKVAMGPTSASALGNGAFSLVSYQPNDSLQYIDDLVLPTTAQLNVLRSSNTSVYMRNGHSVTVTGGAEFNDGARLEVEDANFTANEITTRHGSINVTGSGIVRAQYMEFASGQGDRSTINISGTGGLDVRQIYLGALWEDAAVTVDQRSGTVTTQVLSIDRSGSVNATSHYHLNGGTLTTRSLQIADGVLHISGGKLEMPGIGNLTSGWLGSKILWESGTISLTAAATAPVPTNGFFSSILSLTPGRTVALNAPGLTSFVNLAGGKLALRELADNGLAMNWQSGELELTGTGGATLGTGKALGDQLSLRQGMTLRTAGILQNQPEARLVIENGGRAVLGGVFNAGEVRLSNDAASLDIVGAAAKFTNAGLLVGSGRITGTVINGATGHIEAAAGESLRVVGNVGNSGQIRITGGELLMTGMLTNETAGKITGRGTIAAAEVDNRGTLTLSAGVSDIDARITNRGSGKVIVTGAGNATVYGNVVNEAGSEFRVSADSRVTFLGTVSNLAAFTGSGVKIFDGNASGAALVTGSGATTVAPGGSLNAAGIREASLTLQGDASITASSIVSRVGSLVFDGGSLDLRNNTLVIDYGSASPATAIRGAIIDGDLKSTMLQGRHAIALVEAAMLGRGSVGDVNVDSSALVVAFALRGDANVDGRVGFDDLLALAQNYNASGRFWVQGDFDHDGRVGFEDLLALAQNYNGSLTVEATTIGSAAFASDFALAMSLVPEPTSLAAVIGLAVVGLRRKR